MQPIPDTPESPTPENRGQSDDFYPDIIPLDNPPNIIAVADELRNLTLHPHPQRNEWVTGCLVCGKPYDQVIEETVADYLDQTETRARRDMLCHYLKVKLTEPLLNNSLDNYFPPPF